MTTVATHVHNAFLCPAHVRGCGCEDLPETICNPYRDPGYCPDSIDQMPQPRVIVRYETAYSVYEVDHTGPGFRVRRLESTHEPTRKQGPDGQWKDALSIRRMPDGCLFIQWSEDSWDATITSPVRTATPVPAATEEATA